jgi:hypothetical protein
VNLALSCPSCSNIIFTVFLIWYNDAIKFRLLRVFAVGYLPSIVKILVNISELRRETRYTSCYACMHATDLLHAESSSARKLLDGTVSDADRRSLNGIIPGRRTADSSPCPQRRRRPGSLSPRRVTLPVRPPRPACGAAHEFSGHRRLHPFREPVHGAPCTRRLHYLSPRHCS